MVKVIATTKGYFGHVVREMGEGFTIPDEIWSDAKRRPSWVRLDPAHAFGGKGDHDGDGNVGGSKPHGDGTGNPSSTAGDAKVVEVPADWSSLHHSKRKALAKQITGEAVHDLAAADAIIAAHVEANKPAPFSDAPAPQTVAQAQAATGGMQPDWEAPGGATQVAD
ncbi:MAG: hypothetical protein ACOY5F_14475 [Pseudomonadota bacterium]